MEKTRRNDYFQLFIHERSVTDIWFTVSDSTKQDHFRDTDSVDDFKPSSKFKYQQVPRDGTR